ncbi:hypothetical protein, partial [Pseudomonas sp. MYb187]|uniref:hypothetical protein n=1 Tax=Pseudomonas sp. MYb187 TaxID=1827299 RepID=UPI002113A2D8
MCPTCSATLAGAGALATRCNQAVAAGRATALDQHVIHRHGSAIDRPARFAFSDFPGHAA